MAEPALMVGRLVVHLHDYRREPTGIDNLERLTVDLDVENPIGSPGSDERMPPVEVWDEQGRVFSLAEDDNWTELIPPDEELPMHPVFEIAEDSTGLILVMAPGTEDEVQVELVPD